MCPRDGSLVPGPTEPSTNRGWSAVDQASAASRAIAAPADASSRIRSLDAVLAEVAQVRAEGVGLDAVDADGEVGVVHGAHDVGTGDVEDLVAALVALEVVERGVGRLEHRAHGAIRHDDALGEGTAKEVGAAAHRRQSMRARALRRSWTAARVGLTGRRRSPEGGSVSQQPSVPPLRDPVMVAAFEGWNDAGEAASGALGHLEEVWGARADHRAGPRGLPRLPGQPADGQRSTRAATGASPGPRPGCPGPGRPVPRGTSCWSGASSRRCAGVRSSPRSSGTPRSSA